MNAASAKPALARLADYLESQRKVITQQWVDAVLADAQIEASSLLTHRQLLDHLPNLLDEVCRLCVGATLLGSRARSKTTAANMGIPGGNTAIGSKS